MKSSINFLLLLTYLLLFSSCNKDSFKIIETKNPIVLEENERFERVIDKSKIKTYLQGKVLDESGTAVAGAEVLVEDKIEITDSDGNFSFGEILLLKDFAVVQVSKPGYFKAIRTLAASKDGFNEVAIRMMGKGISKVVEAQSGGVLDFDGGKVKLNFPKDAIIDGDGKIFKGNVNVFARYINPESEFFLEIMPGTLIGLTNAEELTGLISYGMATVEMQDDLGNKLEIAGNKTVEVKMPAILDQPDNMPIWHFNEKYGLWVEAGKATKSGSEYIFEANYFSTWNLDIPFGGVNAVVIVIQDVKGKPIANQKVNLYSEGFANKLRTVYTNNKGLFNLVRAPRNLGVEVNYSCEVTRKEVTLDRDTVIVIIENDLRGFTLFGKITGCEGLTYNDKFFYISSSQNAELNFGGKTDESGNFEISKQFCSVSEAQTYEVTITLYVEPNVIKKDVFQMRFNGSQKLYFIDYCWIFSDTVEIGKMIDIDENIYNAVKIGNQIWMAENLKTTRLNDGEEIILSETNFSWVFGETYKFCYYNNNSNNNDTYGKLYNRQVVASGKVCPEGWKVPSREDWEELIDYLGENPGGKLREIGTEYWNSPNSGATNDYGFTALPGGWRNEEADFSGLGNNSHWWTTTNSDVFGGRYAAVISENTSVSFSISFGYSGRYIRCIKE